MILRNMLIGFVLITLLGAGQAAIYNQLASQSTTEFEQIADETAPTIILAEGMLANAQKMLGEAVSVGLLVSISEEPVELELDEIRAGTFEVEEEDEDEEEEGEEGAGEEALEEAIELVESFFALNQQIEEYATLTGNDTEVLSTAAEDILNVGFALIEASLEGEADESVELKEELEDTEDTFEALINDIVASEEASLQQLTTAASDRARNTRNIAVGITLGSFLLAIAIATFIGNSISTPLNRIQATADEIGRGNFDTKVTIDSEGVIGSLQTAMQTMIAGLKIRDAQIKLANEDLQEQIVKAEASRLEAERANEVKTTFLASMSHELRTPLNSVINFSKFVARGQMGEVNEKQEQALNKVINSGNHLLGLINDVLDISKIESGSLTLFVEDNIDVSALLKSSVETIQPIVDEKSIDLTLTLDDSLQPIVGDRKRVKQIFLNLLSNAAKFTDEGSIVIEAKQQASDILVSIKDTGQGIAEKDHEAIFESFKQSKEGLRQGDGTGLGLPISKQLAEAHGGKLWLESTVGEGTTFYVLLPQKADILLPLLHTEAEA
ncbi:MAG: ATP-binding protein [Chloroflexota bacterium]